LELRGEGTLMSTAQKGASDLKLASLRRDEALINAARAVAFEIVDADPTLAKHRALASEVNLLLAREEKEFLTKD
ncbi:MAG: DNA helicase RecG, partial [Actinomycetota bacterium]